MDKRTIYIVLACMVALMGWSALVQKLYPPTPKKPKPLLTAGATNAVAQGGATTTNAASPEVETAPVEKPASLPAEQIVAISNDFMRLEFTSWGGGVRTAELLKHENNGQGHVRLGWPETTPALALLNLPGASASDLYEVTATGPRTVTMQAHTTTGMLVKKTLTLGDDYVLSGRVEVVRSSAGTLPAELEIDLGTMGTIHPKETPMYLNVDWQDGPKFRNRDLSRVQKDFAKGKTTEPVKVAWAAVKNQYFAMITMLTTNATQVRYAPAGLPTPPDWKGKTAPVGVTASIEVPSAVTGNVAAVDLAFYAGPKEYDRLVRFGKAEVEAMDFGTFFDAYTGLFGTTLFKGLQLCTKLGVSFGMAIILITFFIKIVLWPIQAKSIKSMKDMQKFQPQIKKLREKYKDDTQRQQQEMMKLYKEHKINPFSGCLPMFVQMPVLFGFYKVLLNSIELRGSQFLWIHDLSQPDTIAHVAGFGINPLPLVMIVAMLWQQKLTPQTGDAQQQKMMKFMPLMMLFFFYNASAGLTLYWTVQQILSVGQQWWTLRNTQDTPAPTGAA